MHSLPGTPSRRSEDQSCPLSGGKRWFATVATWHGKTGRPWCAQPSMSYEQWMDVLQMIYDVGCDGMFYWASGISWGKYFAGVDTSKGASDSRCGIRGLLDFADTLNRAVPIHNKSVSFYSFDGRGPFQEAVNTPPAE
jgi:hypothetical protein